MTGLEVLDTAVKVGLGALLSAGGAYLLAVRNHDAEMKRERTKRRRELLEVVAEDVVSFCHTFLKYWARAADIAAVRREGKEPSDAAKARFSESRAELFDAFGRLTSAQGKLLLLGDKQAQEHLRDLGDFSGQVRSITLLTDEPKTETEYSDFKAKFGSKRELFFDALAKAYSSSVA